MGVRPTRSARRLAALALVALLAVLPACGYASSDDQASAGAGKGAVRLGLFANVTHASALVGVANGLFAKELGSTPVSTQVFNAGPAAVEAIFAGSVDAAYVGPNPAINAFVKSHGQAVRIVAGATSGGAALVVKPSITSVAALKGKKVATPQRGNTQDVAARAFFAAHGLSTRLDGGGDVAVQPTENPVTLAAFKRGDIDAAWLPEPWASRLVVEAGAKVLVDERTLWPRGQFVTTQLIVATKFLTEHPDRVSALLRAHLAATDWITAHPGAAKAVVNTELAKLAGKPLAPAVLDRAWANITVTVDPLAATLAAAADHAKTAGLLDSTDLNGIYDLRPLNSILKAAGKPPVTDAGLGTTGNTTGKGNGS